MILSAAKREDALEIRCASTINELRNFSRAYEADCFDSGMITDRFDDIPSTVHNLEHTFRQSRFPQQLGDSNTRKGHELRWLEDHAISQSDRIRDRPVWNHVREIERSDRRD